MRRILPLLAALAVLLLPLQGDSKQPSRKKKPAPLPKAQGMPEPWSCMQVPTIEGHYPVQCVYFDNGESCCGFIIGNCKVVLCKEGCRAPWEQAGAVCDGVRSQPGQPPEDTKL